MSVINWITVAISLLAVCCSIATLYYGWVIKQELRIGRAARRGDFNAREKYPTSVLAWMISWAWWSK